MKKRYTPEEKVVILRRHLLEKESVRNGAMRLGGSQRSSTTGDVAANKFYDWREHYGKGNDHNGWVPRNFWLEEGEKQAIVGLHRKKPLEGYRRLTFMMLDADTVAVSPSSVWRVLS